MYTLYHSKGACSLAIQAALTMTGAEFQVKTLDFNKGEQRSPEYLAINPLGKVPALKKDDFILTEGMAIHLYLADQYPQAQLFPKAQTEKYHAYKWLSNIYSNVHPHYARLFNPEKFGNDTNSIRQTAIDNIFSASQLLNTQLEQTPFLAGEQISAADLYAAVQLHWALAFELGLDAEFKHLSDYLNRIRTHQTVGAIYTNEFSPH